MYLIDELCQVAAKSFDEAAEKDWNLPSFPLAIQEAYANPESEEKTLRKLVVEHAVNNLSKLLKDDYGDFAQIMVAFGEFGKDVSRALIEGPVPGCKSNFKGYRCPTYGFNFRLDLSKVSAPYQSIPKCPRCHTQHLVSLATGDIATTVFYTHSCTTCDTHVESGYHSSGGNAFWCKKCDYHRSFRYVGPTS